MCFYNDRKLNLKADDYIETTYLMHPYRIFTQSVVADANKVRSWRLEKSGRGVRGSP
jgi:hypothetical protein